MKHVRRLVVFLCFIAVTVPLIAWGVPKLLNPTPPSKAERKRDAAWVASSPYWLDRQTCRWLTLCGIHHIHEDRPSLKDEDDYGELSENYHQELRRSLEWIGTGEARRGRTKGRSESEPSKRRRTRRDEGDKKEQKLEPIPQYVIDHAPLVHLYSGESFWPSDIAEHVQHMVPTAQGGAPINLTEPLSLNNLADLNDLPLDKMIFLESEDDVEDRPEWLHSHFNVPSDFPKEKPDEEGKGDVFFTDPAADEWSWFDVDHDHPLHGISDPRRLNDLGSGNGAVPREGSRHLQRRSTDDQEPLSDPVPPTPMYKPDGSGFSKAPAILVLVRKGPHILDAFWFFFYSYNLGQTVGGIRFGNHVGDWEHCMVRFEDGIPRAVFMSEHAGGQAYAWDAVEKRTIKVPAKDGREREVERFVLYSAVGSHAMYANPGDHPYVLPFNMLRDQTDRGPMWDPSLNTYSYFYDYRAGLEDSPGPEPEDSADASVFPPAESLHTRQRKSKTSSDDEDAPEEEFPGDRGLLPTTENPDIATNWFHFLGPWGDETYGLDDMRQYRLFGQYHYLTGPIGPKVKYLERHKVCQMNKCVVLHRIKEGATWY
ncbi:vacuolar protein sorting-associated protein [Zalerion maritima]|uniref:Vacuolar protein sorting-associated protein n=1 Tax=Zalerion maritima TaxID=339359 RepID=A0AAD5RYI6_9PEZI|nr:vacuolar protein sorting-associated protein [Zalerion maritima]